MINQTKPSQIFGRQRQAKFRERRKTSGVTELRALIPGPLGAEIEIASMFIPHSTKESIVRDVLEKHLPKPIPESAQLIQHIFKNWGQVLAYKYYPPSKFEKGLPNRTKDRVYYYDESVRLMEIRASIERFFSARGIKKPFDAACAIYRYAPKAK